MFKALLKRSNALRDAHAIYGKVVARARDADLFRRFHVPDTFDGRFEMLSLHLFMIHHRLKDEDKKAREVSQCVFDCFIDDMDAALREAAVGDQTVPKRINKMTRVFYGRTGALEEALEKADPEAALSEILSRNIHTDNPDPPNQDAFAEYLLRQVGILRQTPRDEIVSQAKVFESQP
jgi:cytochrome b pre-mRNA-processing protein 3